MTVNPDRVLKAIAAIEAGDTKTVRMMLKAGVPANHFVAQTFDGDQRYLAHFAAASGQFEIFELLVAAGADIDAYATCSWRPPTSMLECACAARVPSLEIVQKILKDGHPSQENLNQSLMVACYGDAAIVDQLLLAGADPNFVDQNLDTPLVIAIVTDNEDIAIRLLQNGADATGTIRNKEQAPYWKKSIQEVVRIKGMSRLAELIGDAGQPATASVKPRSNRKPKTIESCWKLIEDWMATHAPDVVLPGRLIFRSPRLFMNFCNRQLPNPPGYR